MGKGVTETPLSGCGRAFLTLPWSRAEGEARRADVELGLVPWCEVSAVGLAVSRRPARLDRSFWTTCLLPVSLLVGGRGPLEERIDARLSVDPVGS